MGHFNKPTRGADSVMATPPRSPCPCCGHAVHDDRPGSSLICPVCFWEDDLLQLRWPHYDGGANKISLIEAHRNFYSIGAKQVERLEFTRDPFDDEPVEEGFRPINLTIDSFEETFVQERPWPDDRMVLYWWRPTFWRHSKVEEGSFIDEIQRDVREDCR